MEGNKRGQDTPPGRELLALLALMEGNKRGHATPPRSENYWH